MSLASSPTFSRIDFLNPSSESLRTSSNDDNSAASCLIGLASVVSRFREFCSVRSCDFSSASSNSFFSTSRSLSRIKSLARWYWLSRAAISSVLPESTSVSALSLLLSSSIRSSRFKTSWSSSLSRSSTPPSSRKSFNCLFVKAASSKFEIGVGRLSNFFSISRISLCALLI